VVFFYHLATKEWGPAISGAVLAVVFGLEWMGVPVLGRWWRKKEEQQEPPTAPQRRDGAPGKQHVGPFWKASQKDKANNPAPPRRSKLSKRPKNSRPRPKRESKW
jgi:hypothetical protein